ncbi:hypothetical protein ACK30V_17035, partial [Aeromonas caviae]
SRSFWRYWVSAIGKFIPKSGAECRLYILGMQSYSKVPPHYNPIAFQQVILHDSYSMQIAF